MMHAEKCPVCLGKGYSYYPNGLDGHTYYGMGIKKACEKCRGKGLVTAP